GGGIAEVVAGGCGWWCWLPAIPDGLGEVAPVEPDELQAAASMTRPMSADRLKRRRVENMRVLRPLRRALVRSSRFRLLALPLWSRSNPIQLRFLRLQHRERYDALDYNPAAMPKGTIKHYDPAT